MIVFPTSIRLVILRGLPGSGKSTLARSLAQTQRFVHLEADQFMIDAHGNYRFDPARASDAHAVCQQRAFDALRDGKRVVIANTHVRLWEFAPYVGLAQIFQCDFHILECRGAWDNIHGVNIDTLNKMREKWEPMPAHLLIPKSENLPFFAP